MARISCSWKGCVFGCLGVIVLGIICSISLGLWLGKKGEFEEAATVLRPDTELYTRFYVQPEDVILVDFLTEQIDQMNRNNPGANWMPDALQSWNSRKQRKDIEKMLPMEIEVAGMVTEERMVASVGFSIYGNAMKILYWFFKRDARGDGRLHRHGETDYVEIREHGSVLFFLALKNNVIYITDSDGSMKNVLDGVVQEEAVVEDLRFAGLDQNAPIYGYASGFSGSPEDRDIMREKLDFLLDDVVLDEQANLLLEKVSRLAYQVTVRDEETLDGIILLDTPERDASVQAVLEQMMTQAAEDARLKVEWDIVPSKWGFQINFSLSGFADAVPTHGGVITVQ